MDGSSRKRLPTSSRPPIETRRTVPTRLSVDGSARSGHRARGNCVSWRRAMSARSDDNASGGWVVPFEEGGRDMRDLLGGKGANVAEMTRVLGPDRVPPGFTITTEACVAYMKADQSEP